MKKRLATARIAFVLTAAVYLAILGTTFPQAGEAASKPKYPSLTGTLWQYRNTSAPEAPENEVTFWKFLAPADSLLDQGTKHLKREAVYYIYDEVWRRAGWQQKGAKLLIISGFAKYTGEFVDENTIRGLRDLTSYNNTSNDFELSRVTDPIVLERYADTEHPKVTVKRPPPPPDPLVRSERMRNEFRVDNPNDVAVKVKVRPTNPLYWSNLPITEIEWTVPPRGAVSRYLPDSTCEVQYVFDDDAVWYRDTFTAHSGNGLVMTVKKTAP